LPRTKARPETVLILAPLGRDAEVMSSALAHARIAAEICRDIGEVTVRMSHDVGVIVLTEEALTRSALAQLVGAVDAQPPWSDVPVIVLTAMGRMAEPSAEVLTNFQRLGNVTLLERPIRVMTLVSTVEAGLHARRRQYEVRDHLAERQRRSNDIAAESRAKDEFLAMLGHELRNPLGAISAAVQVLDMAPGPEGDSTALARRVMVRQVRHMARLVDDLLDVGRVTSGKIEITRRPLDAAEAVANCIAALRATGAVHHHTLNLTAVPVWVEADDVRVDQIVTNLLVNALKYTPDGGHIDVSVEAVADEAVIRVRDTGSGIAPDLLPRVFDLFVQGGRAIERRHGGLGIGLTLVRRLVELHGGRVEASSAGIGQGSAFTVRLPAIAAPADPTRRSTPRRATTRRRVLLIEDNDDARRMIAFVLEQAGHNVYEAVDGLKGVETALRQRPDIAIVDLGLPGLDGYEVAQRIRSRPETSGMVLIALTGYGRPEDRRRAAEAGFDQHLLKPVDIDQLVRAVALGS
jgi:signal transduction histidine kinase/CheY-like chemotaxis protein